MLDNQDKLDKTLLELKPIADKKGDCPEMDLDRSILKKLIPATPI